MSPQLIGLVAHTGKQNAAELVHALRERFQKTTATLQLETKTAALIGETSTATTRTLGETCDLLVVLGGDGTLLQVVHDLEEHIKPVFGINLGSLGFLTCLAAEDYAKAVDSIVAGNFVLSPRTRLQVTVQREGRMFLERTGLNDAVISRGEFSRLVRLDTFIDGAPLTEYNADGLVIATPTGSTAYSLSAGGPIVSPDSGVFVITPICPHVLTNRSLIVGDGSEIEVCPRKEKADVFLTVDGQDLIPLRIGDRLRIRKAPRDLPLAMLPELSFSEVIRQKLKWSGRAV